MRDIAERPPVIVRSRCRHRNATTVITNYYYSCSTGCLVIIGVVSVTCPCTSVVWPRVGARAPAPNSAPPPIGQCILYAYDRITAIYRRAAVHYNNNICRCTTAIIIYTHTHRCAHTSKYRTNYTKRNSPPSPAAATECIGTRVLVR